MYCIYCGKELKENEVCSCRMGLPVEPDMEAPTEETPPRGRQDEPNQTAEQVKQTAAKVQQRLAHGAKAAADAVQSSGAVQSSKGLLLRLMKEPIVGLKEAYRSEQKLAQYCLGGLYLVAWFLFGTVSLMRMSTSTKLLTGLFFGLIVTLFAAGIQLIYCIWFNLFSDKVQKFRAVCGTVGAGLWPETLVMLLVTVLVLFFGQSGSFLMVVLLLLSAALDLLSHFIAAFAVCGEKKGLYVCVSALIIVNVLLVALIMTAFSDMASSLYYSILYGIYY